MSLPNYKQILPNPQRLRPSGSGQMMGRDQSPFIHSAHSNPSFTPQKAGKSSSASIDSRYPKPPKAPEKPVMPYMRYSKKQWEVVKNSNPELKLWEIGKKIGMLWRDLSEAEKQVYIDEYEAEKSEYEKALKAYHTSPAYLAYMSTKSKKNDPNDIHDMPRSSSKSQQDRRVDIQPAEDEEDQDDGFSFKQVAYNRYTRNHRLINEIFSDAIVPDVRSVVTTQRMHVLKRQVQSLAMHQMKLQAELQQIEEKFEAKKMKFMESSELFQEELKKHCKPAVDEDTFQKMVERQYEALKRERLRIIEDQNKPQAQQQPQQPTTVQKPAEEVSVQANAAQPAGNAELPPAETQSTSEPMDIEPPIKSSVEAEEPKSILEHENAVPPTTAPVAATVPNHVTEMAPIKEHEAPVEAQANVAPSVSQEQPQQAAPTSETAPHIPPVSIPTSAPQNPPTSVAASPTVPPPMHAQEPPIPAPNVTVNPSMGMGMPPHGMQHGAPYGYPMQGGHPPRPYYSHMPYQQGYPNYPYGHHMPPYQQNYHPYGEAHPAYPPQGPPMHPGQQPPPQSAAPPHMPNVPPTTAAPQQPIAVPTAGNETEEKNDIEEKKGNDEKEEEKKKDE
ncbi:hypothetical protein PVAND_015367 [Polypedilum vanderplanki]|uniref:HMG box domain-containing protein n=1 Tax=Polypedilum vanderplanki TaxID=319348 RepID=A0A9J6BCF2_POLVA|nr:hypothetical protein PVAND_015367 [Polypedilum vanderplanki]